MNSIRIIKLLIFTLLTTVFSFAQYSGGNGTVGDPYKISNLADLTSLSAAVNGGNTYNGVYFILTADIDASATRTINQTGNGEYSGFLPIGSAGNVFQGSFDGNFRTISNLFINRFIISNPTVTFVDNIGLFGITGDNAVIQNLQLFNAEIKGNNNVGGFVGTFNGIATNLINCHFSGKLTGNSKVGGIVGIHSGITLKNSFSDGYINGVSNIGGIAGELNNASGIVTNVYNTALINTVNTAGGIVGLLTDGSITNSFNIGAVTGNYNLGAIVGENTDEPITACFFNPHTSNTSRSFGKETTPGFTTGIQSKTRAEMVKQVTYTGWTFDVNNWVISEGNTLPYFSFQNIVAYNTEFNTTSPSQANLISQVLLNTGASITINEYGFIYSKTNPLPDQNDTKVGVATGVSISNQAITIANQAVTGLLTHNRYYARFYSKDTNGKYYFGNTMLLLPPEGLAIVSANTNDTRDKITIEFNKDIDPASLTASDFGAKSDAASIPISSINLTPGYSNKLDLNFAQTLAPIPVLTVTYTAGTLASTDGGKFNSISNYTIKNSFEYNGKFEVGPDNNAANKLFGTSVASFGEYFVVGAPGEALLGANSGLAYVFKRNGQKWEKVAILSASDGAANDLFGTSVDFYHDIIIVGASGENSAAGAVYVYKKPLSGWTDMTEVAKLKATDGNSSDNLGISVAISGDVIVAGATGGDNDYLNPTIAGTGAGYVFIKPKDGWKNVITETAKLLASSATLNDLLGTSIAISGDYVILGAKGRSSSAGAAFLFEKPKDGWKNSIETAILSASDAAAGDLFGSSITASNEFIAVGATAESTTGAVYIFKKPLSGWLNITEIKKIIPTGSAANDLVGTSVKINGDLLAIGAIANSTTGSVHMFKRDPLNSTIWNSILKVNSGSGIVNEKLGASIAINGNFLISGAIGVASASGKVHIYNSNTIPTGTNSSVTTSENVRYNFKFSDFPFTDPDNNDALYGVEIRSIQTPLKGSLESGGGQVNVGDIITDLTTLNYMPAANEIGAPYVSFTYKLIDSFNSKSTLNYTMDINVSDVNNKPTGGNKTIAINEDAIYTFLQADFGYADIDNTPMNSIFITVLPTSGKLFIDDNLNNIADSNEILSLNSEVLTSKISASQFKYIPGQDSSGTPLTTFNFKVSDGVDKSNNDNTITFNVAAVNDAPVISNVETTIDNYTIGKDSIFVSTSLSIIDVDDANLTEASVKIGDGFDVDDTLSYKTQSGITGVFANGEMKLTGNASYGNYAKAIQSISFRNFDVSKPITGIRTIEFWVKDASVKSEIVTRKINVLSVQNIPTIDLNSEAVVQEGNTVIINNTHLLSTNPDNTVTDLKYEILVAPKNGAFSPSFSFTQSDLNTGKVSYTHNGNESRLDSLTFTVRNKDGVSSPETKFYIKITEFNDPPKIIDVPELVGEEDKDLIVPIETWYSFVEDPDNADSTLIYNLSKINTLKNIKEIRSNFNGNNLTGHTLFFKENWSGTDSLKLKVSDGSKLDSAVVQLTVNDVNDKPYFVDFIDSVHFKNSEFYKDNIWQYVKDTETPSNLLNYEFTSANDSLIVNYSEKTGNFRLDALPYYGKQTDVVIVITDSGKASIDTVLRVYIEDVYTSIDDSSIPTSYELYQNYPNPFNPETTIKFALPEESNVKLSVINLLGEEVEMLVNQIMEQGIHKVRWNANDFSSGIYIYKIEASSTISDLKYNKVEKMLLIK